MGEPQGQRGGAKRAREKHQPLEKHEPLETGSAGVGLPRLSNFSGLRGRGGPLFGPWPLG